MLDSDRVAVSLTVQNLGQTVLSGARLKEFLLDDDLFSEMTAVPESKGVWLVPALASGDTWSVSYVTERGDSLTRLPSLYGVPAHSVLRSLVFENVVSEAWEFVRTNWVEFLGVSLLVMLPLVYFAGRRGSWF